ncbi:hypothetical protein GDO78_022429 [Eleutherodactylus coqui]|uniref:Uncharacterized protein n=1 Tax=Eleutherodactylus coqui TaxID=57060 RepID=A0A8J6B436_ELECQ|nr:hypothetical protein GDO78_022429 [Eleutherodactylus coqui]
MLQIVCSEKSATFPIRARGTRFKKSLRQTGLKKKLQEETAVCLMYIVDSKSAARPFMLQIPHPLCMNLWRVSSKYASCEGSRRGQRLTTAEACVTIRIIL